MEYAAILIKPDAVRDVLEAMILARIEKETGLFPFFFRYWNIDENLVGLIYPDWVDRPEFPAMVFNVTQNQSLLCVVGGDSTIFSSLTRAKGKMNTGGIRLAFRTHSIGELKAMGLSGWELNKKVAENRIHTTDTTQETALICSLALRSGELSRLSGIAPELVSLIRAQAQIAISASI